VQSLEQQLTQLDARLPALTKEAAVKRGAWEDAIAALERVKARADENATEAYKAARSLGPLGEHADELRRFGMVVPSLGQGPGTGAYGRELAHAQAEVTAGKSALESAEQELNSAIARRNEAKVAYEAKKAALADLLARNSSQLAAVQAQEDAYDGAAGAQLGVGEQVAGMSANPRALQAVQHALRQLGKPYEWAAEGPNSYDCSGLTWDAYRTVGVSLPRVAADQYNATTKISVNLLLPGDLLFFGPPGPWTGISHMGMYIGGGKMVQAPTTGDVVKISTPRWSNFYGATRVLPAVPATQPPATQPPATQPPATQPPATQPPATQPPTQSPTTPPSTSPPPSSNPASPPPSTSPASCDPALNRASDRTLLDGVGQLVGNQALAGGRIRPILSGIEVNVASMGECACLQIAVHPAGGTVGMNADMAEIASEASLHSSLKSGFQRPSAAFAGVQTRLHRRGRRARGRCDASLRLRLYGRRLAWRRQGLGLRQSDCFRRLLALFAFSPLFAFRRRLPSFGFGARFRSLGRSFFFWCRRRIRNFRELGLCLHDPLHIRAADPADGRLRLNLRRLLLRLLDIGHAHDAIGHRVGLALEAVVRLGYGQLRLNFFFGLLPRCLSGAFLAHSLNGAAFVLFFFRDLGSRLHFGLDPRSTQAEERSR
jgi:cell wall-associated NlpC family hydrolase